MDNETNKEVKETEVVEESPEETLEKIKEPEEETETIEEESEAESQSSETKTDEETEGGQEVEGKNEIKDVEGETPKERALRLEITRMRREKSQYQKENLFTPAEKPQQKGNVLENYDKEQVGELKTILSAMADELGFVKKDEMYNTLNTASRDDVWNSFLEKHTEFLPENDPEGVFYNQLKEEFSLYKEPTDAKSFQKLLNRVYDSTFSKSAININKINAQKEKAKVASHMGGTAGSKSIQSKTIDRSLRIDALKGFTDKEINELFAE